MFNMKIAFDANDVQRMKSKRLMGVERSCHLLTKRFATNSVFGIVAVNRNMGRRRHLKHVVTLIRTLKFFFQMSEEGYDISNVRNQTKKLNQDLFYKFKHSSTHTPNKQYSKEDIRVK